MMNFIFSVNLVVLLAINSCAARKSISSETAATAPQGHFDLDTRIYQTATLSFEASSGNDYLAMNVPYAPAGRMKDDLLKRTGKTLRDRGEAHITVITPPEYKIISPYLTIGEIKQMAATMNLQKSQFEVRCLGHFNLKDNKLTEVYYLVVASDDLVRFREAVQKRMEAEGGRGFVAGHYYPHITLGFTSRDLHESDGAIKNEKSCVDQPNRPTH